MARRYEAAAQPELKGYSMHGRAYVSPVQPKRTLAPTQGQEVLDAAETLRTGRRWPTTTEGAEGRGVSILSPHDVSFAVRGATPHVPWDIQRNYDSRSTTSCGWGKESWIQSRTRAVDALIAWYNQALGSRGLSPDRRRQFETAKAALAQERSRLQSAAASQQEYLQVCGTTQPGVRPSTHWAAPRLRQGKRY